MSLQQLLNKYELKKVAQIANNHRLDRFPAPCAIFDTGDSTNGHIFLCLDVGPNGIVGCTQCGSCWQTENYRVIKRIR